VRTPYDVYYKELYYYELDLDYWKPGPAPYPLRRGELTGAGREGLGGGGRGRSSRSLQGEGTSEPVW
jgi:hypothetical protein